MKKPTTSTARPKEVYFPDQRSLLAQMLDIHTWAQREGMYDACEWLEREFFRTRGVTQSDGSITPNERGGSVGA